MATPVMSEAETMAMAGPPRQPPAATTMTRPISGGAPPRPPERKTSSWVMAVLAGLGVLAVIALGVGLAMSRDNDDPGTQAPPPAVMPDLTGLTEKEAIAALTKANLGNRNPGDPIEDKDCPDTPTVKQQSPAADASVPADTAVTYQLCKALDKVTVPGNLVGSTRDAAEDALRQAGLEPEFKSVDNARPEGQVTEVEKAGQQVEPGTKITVEVSRGNRVEVPNVVGKTQAVAEALLEQEGFQVDVENVQQEGTPGTVVDQTPKAKEVKNRGSDVTIFVVAEPDPEPSPSESADPDDQPPPPGTGAGGTGAAQDTIGGILRP
jgi:serine/threonine-protein kinase